jgi:hypothetical protein
MPSKKNKTRSKAKKASSRTGKTRTTKRSTQKKSAKKAARKPKAPNRQKRPVVSAGAELKREFQGRSGRSGRRSSAQRAEDFEGLTRAEQADSESVDELAEEGNVFEAGAVAGVQEADDSGEREVRTRELPEDDVPEEYLDKD